MRSLNRKPLFFLLAIGVLFTICVQSYFDLRSIIRQDYAKYIDRKEQNVYNYVRLAKTLSDAGALDDLKDRLEEARRDDYIDFYVLRRNGEPVFFGTADGTLSGLEVTDDPIINRTYPTEHTSIISEMLNDELWLVVGINRDEKALEETYTKRYFSIHAQQVLVMVILVLGVFAYFLRDLLQILSVIQSNGGRSFEGIRVKSREGELFLKGISTYQKAVSDLESQNEMLGGQVLPSLKKEILSGKKPPYDFDCTMVRTDINNFSQIYHNHDVTEFMGIINEFFAEVTHIVSRYNGLVHEFVGDEVIFYFKDEDHPNSFMIALSAVRDINAVAFRFNRNTLKQQGYPFTVKSSLAHGKLRFGPLVNGYGIAGSVLIETVRILSQVKEKDGNVVYFDSRHDVEVGERCEIISTGRVQLKGFTGEKTLYAYQKHRDLRGVLDQLNANSASELAYYRSDRDLATILQYLDEQSFELPAKVTLSAIQVLRLANVTQSETDLSEPILTWMEKLSRKGLTGEGKAWTIFSAVTMLILNLVPKARCTAGLEERLTQYLQVPDKRCVANLLEAISFVRMQADLAAGSQMDDAFFDDEDNRVVANALIQASLREITSSHVKRMRKILSSKENSARASVLYAIGEIAKYHRSKDAIYLNTQAHFLDLLSLLPGFAVNSEEAVRRQALMAIKKSADEKLEAEVWKLVDQGLIVSREVEAVFGLSIRETRSVRKAS